MSRVCKLFHYPDDIFIRCLIMTIENNFVMKSDVYEERGCYLGVQKR